MLNPAVIASLISLIGLLVGGMITTALKLRFDKKLEQYKIELIRLTEEQRATRSTMLDLRLDAEKAIRIARAAAYVEFLKSSAEIAKGQESGNKIMVVDGLKTLTEAKARIAVYGSEQVVSAIAEFERFGPVLNSPDSIKRYVHIVQKMREDGGEAVAGVSGENIAKLLFGSEFVEKL